eukprot:9471272-Alexandrium_andersonii.AAC.1
MAYSLGLLLERAAREGSGMGQEAGGVLAWLAVQSDSLALAVLGMFGLGDGPVAVWACRLHQDNPGGWRDLRD